MSELLPCPFCGSPADPNSLAGPFGERLIQCSNRGCGAGLSGACWQATHEQAVEAWNTRHIPEDYENIDKLESIMRREFGDHVGRFLVQYKAMLKASDSGEGV